MSTCLATDVTSAVDYLTQAYKEEAGLYLAVRDTTVRQQMALERDADLMRFADLFETKEDLLALIGQLDAEMAPAKSVIMSHPPEDTDTRRKLARLLDHVTEIIEEIRLLESHNAELLEHVPDTKTAV